jgi:hypothetical protein
MAGHPHAETAGPRAAPSEPVLVVGFDRFPESEHALVVAADLARRLRAFVHVVHAVSVDDYPIDPDADDWEERLADVLDEQRRTVTGLLAGVVAGWTYQVVLRRQHRPVLVVPLPRQHRAGFSPSRGTDDQLTVPVPPPTSARERRTIAVRSDENSNSAPFSAKSCGQSPVGRAPVA